MTPGSKIILTSRSDKIAFFGAALALTLKCLPQEAYWYFFKTIAFGSTNPEEHPDLAALGMEITVHMNRSFLAANTVAAILRANLDSQFWHKMLRCLRDFANKHLSMFGEHPTDLLQKDRPVYIWTMAKTKNVFVIRDIYQERSPQISELPKIMAHDVLSGRVTSQGKFHAWIILPINPDKILLAVLKENSLANWHTMRTYRQQLFLPPTNYTESWNQSQLNSPIYMSFNDEKQ